MSNDGPIIHKVTRRNGVAGQYSLDATVEYPGEPSETVSFVGSTYGGPIVMVTPNGSQVFVSRDVTERLGSTLTPEWVARFFGKEA